MSLSYVMIMWVPVSCIPLKLKYSRISSAVLTNPWVFGKGQNSSPLFSDVRDSKGLKVTYQSTACSSGTWHQRSPSQWTLLPALLCTIIAHVSSSRNQLRDRRQPYHTGTLPVQPHIENGPFQFFVSSFQIWSTRSNSLWNQKGESQPRLPCIITFALK